MAPSTTGLLDKPKLRFTLVHGTFSRDAPWVSGEDDSSQFRRRLAAELESNYEVLFDDQFAWGRSWPLRFLDNTVSARQGAGRALAEHLTKPAEHEEARHYLVAHSHGGNVALYALRDPDVRQQVDGLFCMATPFLFSEKKEISRDLLGLSTLLLALVTFDKAPGMDLLWAVPLWIYTVFVALVTLTIFAFGYNPKKEKSREKLDEQYEDLRFPARKHFVGEDGGPFVGIIRVKDDEVGRVMKGAYKLGGWIRNAWQRLNHIGGWFIGLYAVTVLLPRLVLSELDLSAEWLNQGASLFDKLLMTPLFLLLTGVLMAMVILRFSFAFDSPRWVANLDTRSEETPWPGEKPEPLHVSLDQGTKGWLRHTKIQGPATAEIAKRVRAANPIV